MMDDNSHIYRLNIIQWNCQSLKNKLVSLEQTLSQERVHIAALNETWYDTQSDLRVSGYNTFRKDRVDGYGGVAVLTHFSVKALEVQSLLSNSNIEILHIKIFNCNTLENILSIYCPPSIQTSQRDWDELFSLCTRKTLIIGDFNGHHSSWSYKTDTRGIQIFDSLLNFDFISLNDGSPTRVKSVNGRLQESSPDISLISTDVAIRFNWNVTNESLGSDHLLIKISSECNADIRPLKKRNYKKADWSSYKSTLNSTFTDLDLPVDCQAAYDLFIREINKAADAHIPYIKINQNPSSRFKPKPYWNVALSKAVAERRLALSIFRSNPIPNNLTTLNDKIRIAQQLIRQSRSESYHKFCTSIDSATSSSDMWRRMKWLKGHRTYNRYIDKNNLHSLLHSLTPDFVSQKKPEFISNNIALEVPISKQEIEKSIKSSDTAPGSDNISFSMIKHLPDVCKDKLQLLYNMFLTNGFVPIQWREIVIIPIHKHGRDPSADSSLRPISLISCLCKVFHSIITKRLEWFLENKFTFSNFTVGFRKSRSCLDNLSYLVSKIQIGFAKNQCSLGCFIDVNNAYNGVDTVELLSILDGLGVGKKWCNYLWNFLTDRNLNLRIENTLVCRKTGQGLAQGDPMSPLLFNVATVNVCKQIDNIYISQYADDFVLFFNDNSLDYTVTNLQLALDSLTKLLKNLGLEASPNKSKVCVFTRSSKAITHNINLKIDNTCLDVVDAVKYLGLWLDRSLRWGKHVNELSQKIVKHINLFKVLSGPGWGVHPKHLRRLYISLIRSRLDYASFIYSNSSKTHLLKLDRLQNQAMRVVGGFIKSTPIHVMEAELHLQPLEVRRYYLAGKFCLKALSFSNGPVISVIKELFTVKDSQYWRRKKTPLLITLHDLLKDIRIHASVQLNMFSLNTWVTNINLQNIIKFIDPLTKAKRDYNTVELKRICNDTLSNYANFYRIYTDGSKEINSCSIGAAFFDDINHINIKLKINCNVSIMHAELIAIAEALSYVESINFERFVIFTDSKSALQHLARCTSTFRGVPIAYAIIKSILDLLSRSKVVILQWIPSHVGIVGNETADALAKQACSDGVDFPLLPTNNECLYIVKNKCRDLWNEYFDLRSREKGIWYKTIQPQPLNSPWIDNSGLARKDLVLLFRLRSGHMPLNKFAHLMRKISSPLCNVCNKEEDAYHILMECVRNEGPRRQIFGDSSIGLCNTFLAYPMSDNVKLVLELVKHGLKNR